MIETVGFEGSKGGLDFNKIVSKVSFRNGVIHKTKYKIQHISKMNHELVQSKLICPNFNGATYSIGSNTTDYWHGAELTHLIWM